MAAQPVVTVLAVTSRDDDFVSIQHVFEHSNWQMHRARTCGEALRFLRENPTPVVLCEETLPDGDWKRILDAAASAPARPRLIVLSQSADERLWADVLDLGGYDLLGKPLDGNELIRVISLAWRQWKHESDRLAARAGTQG